MTEIPGSVEDVNPKTPMNVLSGFEDVSPDIVVFGTALYPQRTLLIVRDDTNHEDRVLVCEREAILSYQNIISNSARRCKNEVEKC
ncbi:hypothetical protein U1Q18_030805 [Sarracenia purpurea var. burkii]